MTNTPTPLMFLFKQVTLRGEEGPPVALNIANVVSVEDYQIGPTRGMLIWTLSGKFYVAGTVNEFLDSWTGKSDQRPLPTPPESEE